MSIIKLGYEFIILHNKCSANLNSSKNPFTRKSLIFGAPNAFGVWGF